MNKAVLTCWTSTGYCSLHSEYPSVAEARRAGRKMVADGFAFSFKIWKREKVEETGEVKLTRQMPDTAHGCIAAKAPRRALVSVGMTGVRLPRHTGTWRVITPFPAVTPKGEDTTLYLVEHERFERSPRMLVSRTGEVLDVKIPYDWQCQLATKGWRIKE